jgi:hypothetical protein
MHVECQGHNRLIYTIKHEQSQRSEAGTSNTLSLLTGRLCCSLARRLLEREELLSSEGFVVDLSSRFDKILQVCPVVSARAK